MAEKRSRYSYDADRYERSGYVFGTDGNTARDYSAAEEYYDDVLPSQIERSPEEDEELNRLLRIIGPDTVHETRIRRRRNFSIVRVALMCVAIISLFLCTAQLVFLRSEITSTEKLIRKADVKLEDIREMNESLSVALDSEPDRNYIYSVAVSKLGMVYPDQNEILNYQAVEVGYVRQYSVIR